MSIMKPKRILPILLACLMGLGAGCHALVDPIEGRILGTVTIDGEPEAGITVTLNGTDQTTTNSDGQYGFDDVKEGEHLVEISNIPEDVNFLDTSKMAKIEKEGDAPVVDFSGHRVRRSGIGGSVEAAGTGLEGITVSAAGPDEAETTTDAAGTYEMVELRAGTYTVGINGYDTSLYDFTETSKETTVGVGETAIVDFVGSEREEPEDEVMVGVNTVPSGLTDPDGVGILFTVAAIGGGSPGGGSPGGGSPEGGSPGGESAAGGGSGLPAASPAADGFGPFGGSYPLAIAGAEGYVVIDLLDGSVLHQQTDLSGTGPFFGVVGITQAPAGDPSSAAMLFAYGANGYTIDRFDQFGVLAFDGPTVDAFPAGGDIVSDVLPFVQLPEYGGVQFFQKESGSDVYTPSGEEYAAFDGQFTISAYTHGQGVTTSADPRGPTLVVTTDENSGLYLLPRTGEGAQRAADLGDDARRVRCLATEEGGDALVCAVTVFGESRLLTFTWDGVGLPVAVDDVTVGSGPIGLSLRRLPDGTIGVVTSGFNDSTITETVVDPDGAVVSSETRPAPEGCTAVANVVWVVDGVGAKVAGACFGSGAYFVETSILP